MGTWHGDLANGMSMFKLRVHFFWFVHKVSPNPGVQAGINIVGADDERALADRRKTML
jgi:hypothetical protein